MPLSNKSLKRIEAWYDQKRRFLLGGMFFAAISLLFSFFFGEMGFLQFSKMKQTWRQSQQEIAALERKNNALLKEIEALKTDPFYMELLARDRLGFMKKGEWTYEFYSP